MKNTTFGLILCGAAAIVAVSSLKTRYDETIKHNERKAERKLLNTKMHHNPDAKIVLKRLIAACSLNPVFIGTRDLCNQYAAAINGHVSLAEAVNHPSTYSRSEKEIKWAIKDLSKLLNCHTEFEQKHPVRYMQTDMKHCVITPHSGLKG